MVKQTDLDKKKELLTSKKVIIKNKIDRAIIEHQLLLSKLNEKLDRYDKELSDIENSKVIIKCCGFVFNTKEAYEQHLTTQLHRRNTEEYIICPITGELFFGVNKTNYLLLPLKEKKKYKWHNHYNKVCFCPECFEEFKSKKEKIEHKCEKEVMVDNQPYNTLDEEIEIDENFDYYRLNEITYKQAEQVESFLKDKMDSDCSYFIKQNNLYYSVVEIDGDEYNEFCSFRIPTLEEDYKKPLNITFEFEE